jgi:hypothetical protein
MHRMSEEHFWFVNSLLEDYNAIQFNVLTFPGVFEPPALAIWTVSNDDFTKNEATIGTFDWLFFGIQKDEPDSSVIGPQCFVLRNSLFGSLSFEEAISRVRMGIKVRAGGCESGSILGNSEEAKEKEKEGKCLVFGNRSNSSESYISGSRSGRKNGDRGHLVCPLQLFECLSKNLF